MTAQSSNADTSAFRGSIPREYHRLLVPLLFREYADDLAHRVGSTQCGAVLETAAGTGVVTRRLRNTLPDSTKLVATDLNQDMLTIAQGTIDANDGTVEYTPADATSLPFEAQAFDAVVCQFGVMFFPDEALGYREAARVLKPGGRFLFNVWDDLQRNQIIQCVHNAIAEISTENPVTFFETPYRKLDMTTILRNLQASGFGEVNVAVLPKPCSAPSASAVVDAFINSSPLGAQIAERGLTERGTAACVQCLADQFAGGDDSIAFTVPMQAVVIEATKLA